MSRHAGGTRRHACLTIVREAREEAGVAKIGICALRADNAPERVPSRASGSFQTRSPDRSAGAPRLPEAGLTLSPGIAARRSRPKV